MLAKSFCSSLGRCEGLSSVGIAQVVAPGGLEDAFAPPSDAVQLSHHRPAPGWVVFPKYVAGAGAQLQPMERARAFMGLVENAFNYDIYGAEGFELLGSLVDRSRCFSFEYGDLAQAVAIFDELSRTEDVAPR